MIKRVFRSESDLHNLSLKRSLPTIEGKNLDYKKKVVNKPWGYEYLMFENKYVAIWILFLKNDFATSMHCHPNKKTSLLVISGSIVISTLDNIFHLDKGDSLLIEKGVFHSSKGLSSAGTIIMEIETPPDKNDLVRLKDNYGRESKPYEGNQFMSDEVHKYEYCDFHDFNLKDSHVYTHSLHNTNLIVVYEKLENILDKNNKLKNNNYCFLDDHNQPATGEIFNYNNSMNLRRHKNPKKHLLLIIN